MIKYSDEFKAEVLKSFPLDRNIRQMLTDGNEWLGNHLSNKGISVDEILKSTSLETLKTKATQVKRMQNLYRLFWKEQQLNTVKYEPKKSQNAS